VSQVFLISLYFYTEIYTLHFYTSHFVGHNNARRATVREVSSSRWQLIISFFCLCACINR